MSIRATTAMFSVQDFLAARLLNATNEDERRLLKSRIALYTRMRNATPDEQTLLWQGIEIPAPPVADNAPVLRHLPAVAFDYQKPSDICVFKIEGELAFRDDPEQLASRAQGAKEIEININSCGGSGEWAHKFGSELRKTGAKITANIITAHSAAATLAQYADVRRIHAGGSMMIHDSQFACFGSSEDFRRIAAWLDTFREADIVLLTRRTKQAREVVESWLATDSYFTAEEALAAALVDEVIPP